MLRWKLVSGRLAQHGWMRWVGGNGALSHDVTRMGGGGIVKGRMGGRKAY